MRNPLRALFERRMDSHGLYELLRQRWSSVSGQAVTEDSALRISTVTACVSVISRTVASLPLGVYRRTDERTRQALPDHWLAQVLAKPNAWQTTFTFVQVMEVYLLLHRNAYAWVNWVPSTTTGLPVAREIIPIHPSRIGIEQADVLSTPTYRLTRANGQTVPLPAREVFHLRGLSTDGVAGRPLLADGVDVLGLAQVQQEHAGTWWGNGGRPDVLLKHPRILKDKTKQGLEDSWAETYGGGKDQKRVAVLEDGLDAIFPDVNHESSQFLETKDSTRAEIAAMFHVPGFLAGLEEKQTSWGSGVEQMKNGFATFAVQPDCENWEAQIARTFLEAEPGTFAKFKLTSLLRGDSTSWGAFVKSMREIGVLSANEVRSLMDLNPRDGGDEYDDLAYSTGAKPAAAGDELT
jgi:HK97 family phage portal protein